MGVDSLPKIVTRRRRGCDLNPSPSCAGVQHANRSATEHALHSRNYDRFTAIILDNGNLR